MVWGWLYSPPPPCLVWNKQLKSAVSPPRLLGRGRSNDAYFMIDTVIDTLVAPALDDHYQERVRGLPRPVRSPSCRPRQGCGWQGSVEGMEPSGQSRGARRTRRRTEGLLCGVTHIPGRVSALSTVFIGTCAQKKDACASFAGRSGWRRASEEAEILVKPKLESLF